MEEKDGFLLFGPDEFNEWLPRQDIRREVVTIQNHHTWHPDYSHFTGDNHFELLQGMKDYHVNTLGWDDIGQHITTFPDGTIAACRPFELDPACIKGHNVGAVCIENLGNFDNGKDRMRAEQRRTIIYTNAVLCKKFRVAPTTEFILYHHWYSPKTCPGTSFFNGNGKRDAEENFLPRIVAELENL